MSHDCNDDNTVFPFDSAHPQKMTSALRWVPLESNPELFSSWSSSLGLDTTKYEFCDVFGLDDELLAMVPQPVHAVLLLFPVTEAYEAKRHKDDEGVIESDKPEGDGELLWFKQTVGILPGPCT